VNLARSTVPNVWLEVNAYYKGKVAGVTNFLDKSTKSVYQGGIDVAPTYVRNMKGSLPHVSMFDYTQGWVVFKQTPTICIKHSLGKSKQFAHFQKSFVSSFLASSAELPAPELVCLNTCPDTWPCKTAPCYRAYHPMSRHTC